MADWPGAHHAAVRRRPPRTRVYSVALLAQAPRALSLRGVATPCRRAGRDHLHRCRPCVRKGPAVPASLTSLTSDARPCPRAGCDHLPCRRQCVREGPAAPAGRTSLLGGAAPCCAGGDRLRCGHQGVRERSAAPAGITSLTSDVAPCLHAGRDRLQCCHLCVRTGAGSTSKPYASHGRCSDPPSCRI